MTSAWILLAEIGILGGMCVNWEEGNEIMNILKHIEKEPADTWKGGAGSQLKKSKINKLISNNYHKEID